MIASGALQKGLQGALYSLVGGLLAGLLVDQGRAAEDQSAQEPRRFAAEYRQDFRNERYDPRWFRVDEGPPDSMRAFFRPDPRGLHIVIPRGSSANLRLGTGFQVHGDFEIIATYEVISAPRPATGFGVGPEVHIKPPGGWDRYASACWFVRNDGSEVIVMAWGRSVDGKKQVSAQRVPAKSRSGRLRLRRTGTRLDYAVDDGETGQFRPVYTAEYGAEDVEKVRLDTIQGGSSGGCEMIWKDLTVRADDLPGWSSSEYTSWWWVLAIVVLLSAILGGGVAFRLRRRNVSSTLGRAGSSVRTGHSSAGFSERPTQRQENPRPKQ